MCPDRFHSPTASALSLRTVINLNVVWPSPSTPAGMPPLLPKSLSQNVDASKTQRTRPLSRMKLILSLGHGVCYHRVVSSCRACFVKECQCWFKLSLSLYVMLFGRSTTPPIFYHNNLHTSEYTHTQREKHILKTLLCWVLLGSKIPL